MDCIIGGALLVSCLASADHPMEERYRMRWLSPILLVLLLAAPVSVLAEGVEEEDFTEFHDPFDDSDPLEQDIPDPLESVNRASFWLNDKIYTYLLGPICRALPDEALKVIADSLDRLSSPLRIAHAEMNLPMGDAGMEIGRFALEGAMALFGSTDKESEQAGGGENMDRGENIDRTLDRIGVSPRFYLVLPVLGPATLKESVGRLASFYLCPVSSLGEAEAISGDKSLSENLRTYDQIRMTALDPYIFVRSAYAQQTSKGEKSES